MNNTVTCTSALMTFCFGIEIFPSWTNADALGVDEYEAVEN